MLASRLLGRGTTCLIDPLDMLLESKCKTMSFGFTDAVVKLKDLHRLSSFKFTLNAMFIKRKLTVFDIELRLEQDVEELGLKSRWTPEHEVRALLSCQDMWMLVTIRQLLDLLRLRATVFGAAGRQVAPRVLAVTPGDDLRYDGYQRRS